MKTCKQLALQALKLEREGNQLAASKVWRKAKAASETIVAFDLCETRESQSLFAGKSELHSAANGDSTC